MQACCAKGNLGVNGFISKPTVGRWFTILCLSLLVLHFTYSKETSAEQTSYIFIYHSYTGAFSGTACWIVRRINKECFRFALTGLWNGETEGMCPIRIQRRVPAWTTLASQLVDIIVLFHWFSLETTVWSFIIENKSKELESNNLVTA